MGFFLCDGLTLTEKWRREYNTVMPHSSLDYRPPIPETIRPQLKLVTGSPKLVPA